MIARSLFMSVTVTIIGAMLAGAQAASDANHETRDVLGWKVHINKKLLVDEPEATAVAIGLLQKQLEEIIRVVPAAAVHEMKKVPLWFSPEYPGVPPKAEFHPDMKWLRDHGRNPAMAQAVEFTDIKTFPEECERMPNFTLHELAHAYHYHVLGFDDPAVREAFERAKAAGLYDRVERRRTKGRPSTFEKAYALTNEKEYFAEVTEAYFSRNDFFPFTRDELRAHDPYVVPVLEKAWGLAPPVKTP